MSIPSVRSPDVPDASPPDPSPFLQNIRKIRSDGEQLRAEAKDRENARMMEALEGHLHTMDCIEVLRDRIELQARELIAEAPDFRLTRRFFDGRYMVELNVSTSRTDDEGRSVRELSRLAFLLAPEGDDRLKLERHATVRDHDLPVARLQTSLGTGDESMAPDASVDTFLDEQFLAFARAYFDGADEPASTAGTTPG